MWHYYITISNGYGKFIQLSYINTHINRNIFTYINNIIYT